MHAASQEQNLWNAARKIGFGCKVHTVPYPEAFWLPIQGLHPQHHNVNCSLTLLSCTPPHSPIPDLVPLSLLVHAFSLANASFPTPPQLSLPPPSSIPPPLSIPPPHIYVSSATPFNARLSDVLLRSRNGQTPLDCPRLCRSRCLQRVFSLRPSIRLFRVLVYSESSSTPSLPPLLRAVVYALLRHHLPAGNYLTTIVSRPPSSLLRVDVYWADGGAASIRNSSKGRSSIPGGIENGLYVLRTPACQ